MKKYYLNYKDITCRNFHKISHTVNKDLKYERYSNVQPHQQIEVTINMRLNIVY
jgi:hypothetical protein